MKLLSKKKLFEFLDKNVPVPENTQANNYFQMLGLKAKGVGNETFGKDSHIFLRIAKTHEERRDLERKLSNAGFKVNRTYWPESTVIDVQVSYFKGWHWDE